MNMAVEFSDYLKQCEVSEFCVSLQSSLTKLIGSNETFKSSSICNGTKYGAQSSAETVSSSSNDRPTVLNGLVSTALDSNVAASNHSLSESCSLNGDLTQSSTVSPVSNDGKVSLKEAYRDDEDNLILNNTEHLTNGSVNADNDSVFNSNLLCSSKCSEKQQNGQQSSADNRLALNNIAEGEFCEDFNSNATSASLAADDNAQSSSNDQGAIKKSCQRQLSLPVGYSSRDAEVSLDDTRARRRRHSVRFADEIGEILSTFITIPSNEDHIIESYAQWADHGLRNTIAANSRLKNPNLLDSIDRISLQTSTSSSQSTFLLCFDQPSRNYDDLLRKLQINGVCLECVRPLQQSRPIPDSDLEDLTRGPFIGNKLECKVKVRNIDACKSVVARCTRDEWKSFTDISAERNEVVDTEAREYEVFSFIISKPLIVIDTESFTRSRENYVEFAIRYQVRGLTFWDNNEGKNYRIIWK